MLVYIILFTNIFSFALYGIDKRRAIKDRWRISERALLLSRVAFSAPGALLGMKIFHHKTNKFIFWAWNILWLIARIALVVYLAVNAPWLFR